MGPMIGPAADAYLTLPPAVAAYTSTPAAHEFRPGPPVSDGVLVAGAVLLALVCAGGRRLVLRR